MKKTILEQFEEFKEFAEAKIQELGYLELKGRAMSREVYIFDKPLLLDYVTDPAVIQKYGGVELVNPSFNWGYNGESCQHLGYAILQAISTLAISWNFYKVFTNACVAFLPNDNFHVRFDLKKFVDSVSPTLIHAYDLMQINVNQGYLEREVWVSKFLDFPNLRFSNAIFQPDCLEYDMLSDLLKEPEKGGFTDFKYLQKYCERTTKRKDIGRMTTDENGNPKGTDICTLLEFYAPRFIVSNGMGSGMYKGHKIGTYERL